MATCYDCIHCGACSDAGDSGFSSLKEDVRECKHFKNKADFVEVVRCKDCKHWNEIEMQCENDYVVTDNEGGASFSLNFYLDDFCSYGTQKERGGDK